MVRAGGGMKSFTPRSTSELRTCLATAGNGALTTAEPMNQAMSSTETTLTPAPPRASTIATGRQVTRDRATTPSSEASNCPIMAAMNTRMMATSACCEDPCTKNLATPGENAAPTAAPARNPMQLSTPTMKPCRYPATANAAASTIKIRSSRSPGISPRYRPPQARALVVTAPRPHRAPGPRHGGTSGTSCDDGRQRRGSGDRLAARGGVEHVGGEVLLAAGVPGLLPPAEREQPVHEQRGEAPDQHAVHAEGRARGAGGMPHAQPVGRVGEVGQPGPGRRHDLPARGAHRPLIGGLDRAPGEGRLARVAAQVRPALHDQQVGGARRLPEQQQDRRGAAAPRRGPQPRRDPHLPGPLGQLGEPGRGHEKGPSLTSFLASFSSTGPMPNDGHRRAMAQAPHAGRRAWQTRRPCQISRCESMVHSERGNSAPTSASTLTGSVSVVQPSLAASRPKWVSTVMPGTPNAFPSTTLAVFLPTPGSVTRSFRRRGTSPRYRSHSAWPSAMRLAVLAR